MTRRMLDQTTTDGWDDDLVDLQRETRSLLASVRTPEATRSRTHRAGGPKHDIFLTFFCM